MQNTGDVSAIFFDLDGTLTDPMEGITGCVQFALENMGETVPTKDELTWYRPALSGKLYPFDWG